ncbi:MAG: pitrilysin family protein [Gammaproteobacteria bacterium]|nr:pitrilysin family protein [Gammaproteobacteria bacterium]
MSRLRYALGLTALLAAAAMAQQPEIPQIPYQQFTLDNGLTLIVHEDDKAPIVAVNVWYHVGAKNEVPGKTGFAHLFEHLMFNGSEHYNDDYFKPFDRVGATEMNGTTNSDRTNYFQNVPNTALDMALWMESDRMCCMRAAVDQERLDEQRSVVQNEKRQGENQPYGKVFNLIQENTYPAGHPYDGTVIGSMEDLEAASLEDVHQWFDTYYGPNNAVLVVAGDVEAAHVRERVEHYFGAIPPGPPINRHESWVAPRETSHRQVIQDRVPQARVYKTWNVPERSSDAFQHLKLFADVWANGKTSRLYEALVYDRQIATDVQAIALGRELGSLLIVFATARPGESLQAVEAAMDAELKRLLDKGVQRRELEAVKTRRLAGFIRGVERVGGFGGKSDVLAESQVYDGSPDGYLRHMQTIREATAAAVSATAREWLRGGTYTLAVRPFPELRAGAGDADRSAIPFPESHPEVAFPGFERATLDNGLELVVANWPAVPAVDFSLVLDAGYSADAVTADARLGTASLTMDMLDEGAGGRDALEISDRLDRLGARLELGADLDTSYANLSALKANLDETLELYADIVLNPDFPAAELERLRQQTLARISQEQSRPQSMALRLFPTLIYGDGHPYAMPFTGTGTRDSVTALTRDDLAAYHADWFQPGNATLVVTGDTTMAEIRPLVEKRFRDWRADAAPEKPIPAVEPADTPRVYVVDRPGSEQSMIIAGHVVPPYGHPQHLSLQAASDVLGGSFSARVNMNLREDKGWSYGARSIIANARGHQPFFMFAPVQTDKTAESMAELEQELRALSGKRPPTAAEIAKVKDQSTLTLPGRWETRGAIAGAIREIVRFDLADDYWDRYPEMVRGLDVPTVTEAAQQLLHPDRLTWVVIGDWAEIEESVRDLDIGEVQRIDARGESLTR